MATPSEVQGVKDAIATVDRMIERCEAVAKRELPPIQPDRSYPVRTAPAAKSVSPALRPVSWEPQERFEQIRRAGGGYKPLCGHGYGEDVDAAFDACSRAPI